MRESLHFETYIEHAQSLKIAADENFILFKKILQSPDPENRIKQLGLFRSTNLLYALSIELIFKARVLYEERLNIESGKFKDFKSILNAIGGSGH